MNEQPYFCCGNLPSEGHTATCKGRHDWAADPDWFAVAQNAAHPQHHIDVDRYGNHICRECSTDRLYVLRDDEIDRLLLVEREQ